MRRTMKRKVSRMVSLSMALVLMTSFNTLHASAQEYEAEGGFETGGIEISLADGFEAGEDFAIGDRGLRVPGSDNLLFDKEITAREFNVEWNENIIQLDAGGIWAADVGNGIQTFAADAGAGSESTLRCGTVSDYLSETDDYRLYGFNLSAGDYLQVRLSVPNNAGVSYCIPIFDSEFNLLKRSTYPAYSNDMQSSEQSVGYLCTSDEEILFGAYSLSGGSATVPFILEFSVTTNFSDSNEPNEHALEAVALPYGISGTTVSGRLNSPVDDDWYSFTVPSGAGYNRTRLNLTSTSSLNGCKIEIYKINSGMMFYGRNTSEMELRLPAGTYYVRVSSANAFSDFYPGDIPVYNLSVVPVGRVDGIKLMHYTGNDISMNKIFYKQSEEPGYRVKDDPSNNCIAIKGLTYYKIEPKDESVVVAQNVTLIGEVINESTGEKTYGIAVSDQEGIFTIKIYFGDAIGQNRGISPDIGTHLYDYMTVNIYPYYDETVGTTEHFYLAIY